MEAATLPPLGPNEKTLTRERVAQIAERIYPKWMYHPTEEKLLVGSAAVEEGLGIEWAEEPYGHTEDLDIQIPETREEYYCLGQDDAVVMIHTVTDQKALRTFLTSESAHPRRASGRPKVLEAIEERIADLEIEAADKLQPPAKKPSTKKE